MDIVLFFQSTSRKSWLQKLAGVHAFAREHNWFVQVIESYASAEEIRHALDEWHPVGCLVDRAMSNGAAPDHLFCGIPTVYLDQRRTHRSRRHPCLLHDSAAEAALAGGELLDLKCASYAYIGTGLDYHWDKDRLAEFSKAAKSKGKTVVALPLAGLKDLLHECEERGAGTGEGGDGIEVLFGEDRGASGGAEDLSNTADVSGGCVLPSADRAHALLGAERQVGHYAHHARLGSEEFAEGGDGLAGHDGDEKMLLR